MTGVMGKPQIYFVHRKDQTKKSTLYRSNSKNKHKKLSFTIEFFLGFFGTGLFYAIVLSAASDLNVEGKKTTYTKQNKLKHRSVQPRL